MSKIEIKINHTKSVNIQIKQLSSKLTDSKVSISMLRNHVDSQVAHRRNIGLRLNDAITRINASEKRMQDLYQCIEHSMDLYIKAEKRVQSLKLAEVEKKSIWDTVIDSVKGFGKGLGTAVVSTVEGIWYLFNHPVETIKGTIHVITHPVETGKAIWKSISDSWKKDVVNGDAESRSQWFGRGFGEVALAIVGTKGVDKGVKLLKGSEVLSNEVGGVRIGRATVDEVAETRLIPGMPGVVIGGDSSKLGKNMLEQMGLSRSLKWSGYQAQHIIPSEMKSNILIQKIGMNFDDSSNGIFLRVPNNDLSPMSRHRGYHSVYNEVVLRQLNNLDINQDIDVLQKQVYDLQKNLRKLQENGLPLYPSQGATVELWERKLKQLKEN